MAIAREVSFCVECADCDGFGPSGYSPREARESALREHWTYENGVDRCLYCSQRKSGATTCLTVSGDLSV